MRPRIATGKSLPFREASALTWINQAPARTSATCAGPSLICAKDPAGPKTGRNDPGGPPAHAAGPGGSKLAIGFPASSCNVISPIASTTSGKQNGNPKKLTLPWKILETPG